MANYFANISGAANIQVPFNPYQVYTGNGNYVRLELNCDNLRTDSTKANAAIWLNATTNWFSFEMYGEGWEYFNLGGTTYIGRYDYWSTDGFEETLVLEINNGAVTLTKGQQTSATTFGGSFANANISFFPTTFGVNTRVNFYEWKAYGANNTLLFDFVPDYNGTTKGLRDKVSGNFYAATDQTKIELTPLSTFEIAPTESAATYESGTTTITVNTDNDSTITWTASTNDSWLSLSPSTGAGDGSVVVSYGGNQSFQSRTGTVTFTSSEGDVLTFTIEQEKKPVLVYDHPIYRSGNLIKKMYRSGELIYLRLNPQSEEPEPPTPTGYTDMPLTFEITTAGNLKWYAQNGSYTKTIEYKKNDGEWTQITSSNAGTIIPVEVGDIVQFRGDNDQYAPQDGRCSCWCGTTANYKMYGNIMSLIDSTGFTTLSSFTQQNVFMNFFNSGGCIDAENLILPATALTNYCYQGMLAQSNNLQVGPLLPVETLVTGCYAYMFYHSYQINNIRCLATNISAGNCLNNWVNGAPSSGTFYKNPNMSSWNRGSSGVPNNWTLIDYTE